MRLTNLLFPKKQRTTHWVAAIHALLLTVVSVVLMNNSVTYGDESMFLKGSALLERLFFETDKPNPSDYIFINIAYDTEFVPKYAESGDSLGVEYITNRAHLARLFDVIAELDTHRYLICDVFFDKAFSSQSDSNLAVQLARTQRAIFPCHYDTDSGKIIRQAFPVEQGLAIYYAEDDGGFLKFDYMNKNAETLPVHLYRMLDGKQPLPFGPFYWQDGRIWLQHFIPEMRIRNYDLLQAPDSLRYPYFYMKDLVALTLDETGQPLPADIAGAILADFFANKLVVIGDFTRNDIHQTAFGTMGGTLILLNSYLTLHHRDNQLSWLFLLLMLLVYYRLTMIVLDYRVRGHAPIVWLNRTRVGHGLIWLIAAIMRGYTLLITNVEEILSPEVMSRQSLIEVPGRVQVGRLLITRGELVLLLIGYFIVSFFVFAKPVNFILLIVYISLLDFLVRFLRHKHQQKLRLQQTPAVAA